MNKRAHAILSDAVYYPPEFSPSGRPVDINVGEETFVAVEHMDMSSGYQGTIFRNESSGDYVIAHRGTEFDRELLKDGVVDMVMVTGRFNAQLKDALELTRIAKGMAERDGKQLSVTGHSLGGGLGQVCAHHYNLPGELMPHHEPDIGTSGLGKNGRRDSKRPPSGRPGCLRGRRDTRAHPHLALNRLPMLALIALLAACGRKEPPAPPYELNPSPKDAYEITLTTQDAPDDIDASHAYVSYRIADEGCLPPIDNFEGVRYGMEKKLLHIPLQRVDGHTFKGIFFRDGLARKDYFGRGICTWRVSLVGASLWTEQTKDFTYFSISTNLQTGRETRLSKKDIEPLRDDGHRYPASAILESRFEDEVPPEERGRFFSYSISIRKAGNRQ